MHVWLLPRFSVGSANSRVPSQKRQLTGTYLELSKTSHRNPSYLVFIFQLRSTVPCIAYSTATFSNSNTEVLRKAAYLTNWNSHSVLSSHKDHLLTFRSDILGRGKCFSREPTKQMLQGCFPHLTSLLTLLCRALYPPKYVFPEVPASHCWAQLCPVVAVMEWARSSCAQHSTAPTPSPQRPPNPLPLTPKSQQTRLDEPKLSHVC